MSTPKKSFEEQIADGKLNRLVAEKVFNRCVWSGIAGHGIGDVDHYHTSCGRNFDYPPFGGKTDCECGKRIGIGWFPPEGMELFDYCNDEISALSVARAMTERAFSFRLAYRPELKPEIRWMVEFYNDIVKSSAMVGTDVPRLICLSALEALK